MAHKLHDQSASGDDTQTSAPDKPAPDAPSATSSEDAAAPSAAASVPEPAAEPPAPEPAAEAEKAAAEPAESGKPAESGGTPDAAPAEATPAESAAPKVEGESSDFGKALEAHERGKKKSGRRERGPRSGTKVSGKIVAITDTHLMVDIGARSEAVAEIAPFRNEDGTVRVAVGDPIEMFIVEAGEQITLAPAVRAEKHPGIERMREALTAAMPVSGRVTRTNSGGLQVNLGSVRGFCPMSQIEMGRCTEPESYVGKKLEFLVTSIEASRRSVVLSRRRLLRRQEAEAARHRLADLKPGDELEGTVRRLEPFGAFVNLGGLDGMVHVSEIQHGRIGHPRDALREGEKVKVRVLRIEQGKGNRPRIALSIKAVTPDPWIEVSNRFSAGQQVKGVVARRVEFGLFVTLEPGVDGLVHVSELGGREGGEPAVGEEIEVTIRSVDAEKRRISLTTRPPGAYEEHEATPRRRESRRAARGSRPKPPPPPVEDAPLTTMAIALRKAAEEARRKQRKKERRSEDDED